MLVLSRRKGERLFVGNDVVITLIAIGGNRARIGIEAPPEVHVLRDEVRRRDASSREQLTLTETASQKPR